APPAPAAAPERLDITVSAAPHPRQPSSTTETDRLKSPLSSVSDSELDDATPAPVVRPPTQPPRAPSVPVTAAPGSFTAAPGPLAVGSRRRGVFALGGVAAVAALAFGCWLVPRLGGGAQAEPPRDPAPGPAAPKLAAPVATVPTPPTPAPPPTMTATMAPPTAPAPASTPATAANPVARDT